MDYALYEYDLLTTSPQMIYLNSAIDSISLAEFRYIICGEVVNKSYSYNVFITIVFGLIFSTDKPRKR